MDFTQDCFVCYYCYFCFTCCCCCNSWPRCARAVHHRFSVPFHTGATNGYAAVASDADPLDMSIAAVFDMEAPGENAISQS